MKKTRSIFFIIFAIATSAVVFVFDFDSFVMQPTLKGKIVSADEFSILVPDGWTLEKTDKFHHLPMIKQGYDPSQHQTETSWHLSKEHATFSEIREIQISQIDISGLQYMEKYSQYCKNLNVLDAGCSSKHDSSYSSHRPDVDENRFDVVYVGMAIYEPKPTHTFDFTESGETWIITGSSDRTACFNPENNMCDPSGWECENTKVFDVIIESNSSDEPVLHYSEFEGEIFVENRCTQDVSCYGFDDDLKIILDCSDMIMHGCGPILFENYTEAENEN